VATAEDFSSGKSHGSIVKPQLILLLVISVKNPFKEKFYQQQYFIYGFNKVILNTLQVYIHFCHYKIGQHHFKII
jgi:hypothetical protein